MSKPFKVLATFRCNLGNLTSPYAPPVSDTIKRVVLENYGERAYKTFTIAPFETEYYFSTIIPSENEREDDIVISYKIQCDAINCGNITNLMIYVSFK